MESSRTPLEGGHAVGLWAEIAPASSAFGHLSHFGSNAVLVAG